jgi:HD-GYP domain-containing protein (c-di-GMP phosphodiesterase class II)
MGPDSRLLEVPSSLFWVVLAGLLAAIPVRRLMGIQIVNLASLALITTLLLYGTATAILAAWAVGFAAVVSTYSGNLRYDFERFMQASGKHVASMVGAGLVLWGTAFNHGALGSGLRKETIPALVVSYALCLGIRWTVEAVAAALRDKRRIRVSRPPRPSWPAASDWIILPAAYLLALAYLSSAGLTITMLVSVLIVQGLTVSEEHSSRSSWVRLTDGLRQACDGHVTKHGGETQRVVEIVAAIGRRMRLPAPNLRLLGHAAALHNIGYIALDSRIVLRPEKLDPEDITAVRQHPECGRRILGGVSGMADIAEIVRCHHESPDGSGYPQGLEGDAIPVEAAIVKVAEAFVAMTSPRVYRGRALSQDQALEEIAEAAGRAFDPIAAYYLFDTMGRDDLASGISERFGPPERSRIKARLYNLKTREEHAAARPDKRLVLTGVALLASAFGIAFLHNKLGMSGDLQGRSIWFSMDLPGAVFLISLLALAVLKPGRLPWGARCSWASTLVLAMVLAGGPVYIPISGMALIGWSLLLRPDSAGSMTPAGVGVAEGRPGECAEPDGPEGDGPFVAAGNTDQTREIHAWKVHDRVMTRIDRATRVRYDIGPATYALVLMVAGGCAWAACLLGQHVGNGSIIGIILSPLLIGVLSTTAFYSAETLLQASLLSGRGLSPIRIWYRNYVSAFPEPFTFAMLGYGIFIVSGLLGIWVSMLVFTLPLLWRQSVLANRINTLRTTSELVRSIADAVDTKNAQGRAHAWGVAATAVAPARVMGKSEPFVEELEDAAILHDIGKASWPNKALAKRIQWDSKHEHYRYIHPDMSAEIATWAGYSKATTSMIRSHHEHYDGSGYMRGLKGDQIPEGARILGAADSFANMIQGSDPRFSRTLPDTVRELRFSAGKQFDPQVVDALMAALEGAVFSEPEAFDPAGAAEKPEGVCAGI